MEPLPPGPPPTTRALAVACGVNQSTVSRALLDSPQIPQATKDRIRRVAEQMGWRPNPLASAFVAHLRNSRLPAFQANLGFLIANRASGRISDQEAHIQRHYLGAKKRAQKLGYGLEIFWLHEPHLTAKALTNILRNRNVVGLVVAGLVDPSPILLRLEWSQYASTALGYSLLTPLLHRVAVHTVHGFSRVLNKVQDLGYRRIAVVVPGPYDELVDHGVLYTAYFSQKHPVSPARIEVHILPSETKAEIPGIKAWLSLYKPDVVIASHTAWEAIHEMGWRVPQDVAFASTDAAPDHPLIGGFNQRHELHGALAIDLVVEQLLQNERGAPAVPRTVLIEGDWADGLSVPPKADIPKLRHSAALGSLPRPL